VSAILIFFILVLNFGLSWWNAYAVGRVWAETKAYGGFARLVAWSGAIMSACGFTYVYVIILGVGFQAIAPFFLEPEQIARLPRYTEAIFSLGYVMIILPVIGSGLIIAVHSWMVAWRERTFSSGTVATYNTLADVYNIYQAVSYTPKALGNISGIFGGDDDDDNGLVAIVVILVLCAAIGGVVTTVIILRRAAKMSAREGSRKIRDLRQAEFVR